MKFHLDVYEVPKWLYGFLRFMVFLNVIKMYVIPKKDEEVLDDLIDRKFYLEARRRINEIEKLYGISTFTIRYTAKINMLGALGEREK